MLPRGTSKEYKVCNFGLKAEIRCSYERMGEVRWSLKRGGTPAGHSSRPVTSSRVFSGRCTTSQKGSPPQKKDMCELSLSDCIPTAHTLPSKNTNMNYMVIYLRVPHHSFFSKMELLTLIYYFWLNYFQALMFGKGQSSQVNCGCWINWLHSAEEYLKYVQTITLLETI